jgi:hypothetical protein
MRVMIALVVVVLAYCRAFFIGRHRLGLEVAALRQQLVVFKRKQPRPRLCGVDRAFWVALRRLWPEWANAQMIVKPDTVASWHRTGFRLFWRLRSRPERIGRPERQPGGSAVDSAHEVREPFLGRAAHPTANCCNSGTMSPNPRCRVICAPAEAPARQDERVQRWLAFLQNHREVIAGFNFFTCTDDEFPRPVLLLHDRASLPAYSSFQLSLQFIPLPLKIRRLARSQAGTLRPDLVCYERPL